MRTKLAIAAALILSAIAVPSAVQAQDYYGHASYERDRGYDRYGGHSWREHQRWERERAREARREHRRWVRAHRHHHDYARNPYR